MSFAAPLVLAGLLALPALVWLLRAMPPQPKRTVFGGMYFLKALKTPKQQPVRTPLVILLIRLAAFTALVLGLAGPRLGPEPERLSGPMLLVMDDGWDAAQRWDDRIDAARAAIRRTDGEVTILTTTDARATEPMAPAAAERHLGSLQPRPSLANWTALGDAIPEDAPRLVFIAGGTAPDDESLLRPLRGATVSVPEHAVLALGAATITGDAVGVTVHRSRTEGSEERSVRALSRDGRTISLETVRFEPGEAEAQVQFRLPLALRNEIARLDVEGVRSAGTVELLGSSARRTLAGLVSTGTGTLREGGFYIARALSPAAELIEGPIPSVIEREPGLVILDDVGTLRGADRQALAAFVEGGGVLLRFAGPNLLAGDPVPNDPLLTAQLLGGERALGGALTWAEPQRVASVDQDSPLGGIQVIEEIAVRRQVLTEPGASSAEVWASLADGTPLITAKRQGQGLVVLVHVSAAPTWSDLPISGLFANILQRLAALAETDLAAEPAKAGEPLPAQRVLTGAGSLIEPPAEAEPLVPGEPLPRPGLYGEGTSEVAVNALGEGDSLRGLTPSLLPRGSRLLGIPEGERVDLSAGFLAAALLLLILDGILSMGRLPFLRPAAAAIAALAFLPVPEARAQIRPPLPQQATEAALNLRFAYIKTGDPALDRISEAGLAGLTSEAARRSSLEPAAPQGVDPDRDELSVYALLYWPVRPGQEPPSDAALQRLEDFMSAGGMLVIDTADGNNPGQSNVLREVLGRLDAPPLEPLGEDNVLLFSFYRLDDLHGRNSGGRVWVETKGALDQRRDGVPSLIISGRDWASAWALDRNGVPLRPAGPGGEARREFAFRSGINMAMVAITGNYKADQADVQTMLDKLGEDDDEF